MKAIRIVNAVVILLLMVAFLPTQQIAQAQPILPAEIERDTRYIPGEVLVGFPVGFTATVYSTQATALAKTVGAQVVRAYDNMALLSFSPDADVNAISAQLSGNGGALYAQPNYVYWTPEAGMDLRSAPVSSDGYSITAPSGEIKLSWDQVNLLRTKRGYYTVATFPSELKENWGFDKIQAEIIWTNANASPPVCVVDTGVDAKHPELSGKVFNGKDFFNNDTLPADDNGHGTQVAGIIVAKANTGAGTPLGVSNGVVLAVKSLGAQGYGSSFTIAAGIRYCADNSSVKVINLSFGNASGGAIEYNAIYYATKTKGKLIVAAAGNQAGSAKYYPAAWADASSTPPTGSIETTNTIHDKILSVAAGMSPGYSDYWVDKDGSGDVGEGEIFSSDQCAAPFSNYGAWVDIVAPGDAILSTTPVSNPFYENFYGNTLIKQDYWGGTSMAASYVSAAAARAWSVKGLSTIPAVIKTLLMDTGNPLDFAADQNLSNDPAHAWKSDAYLVSPDTTSNPYVQAPFCWPTNNGPYGPEQSMENAVYLNIAKAMGRMGLVAEVTDAGTGLPLNGVTVTAGDITKLATPVIKDTAILNAGGTNGKYSLVVMINLPTKDAGVPIRLQAYKSGYTTGAVTFDVVTGTTDRAGTIQLDPYASVGIPVLNNNISFVLNWTNPKVDLDMFVIMPNESRPSLALVPTPDPFTGIVGPGSLFSYTGLGSGLEVEGSLLLPSQVFGAGSTAAMPYAIRLHDGGSGGGPAVETIQVRGNVGTGLIPLRPMYYGALANQYRVYVTDYSGSDYTFCGALPGGCAQQALGNVSPIVRVWAKGVVVNMDRRVGVIPGWLGSTPDSTCDKNFWYAASMYVNSSATLNNPLGTQVTSQSACGRAGDGLGTFWPEWVH